jgi:hypothetical protein
MNVPVNWWAVIVALLVNYIIGFLWFGLIFRNAWQRLSGVSEMKVTALSVILALIGAFFTSYVLQHAIFFANEFLKTSGVGGGLMTGFFSWLGFIAPVTIGIVTYEKKPFTLWILNNAYWLISLLVMGMILSAWT